MKKLMIALLTVISTLAFATASATETTSATETASATTSATETTSATTSETTSTTVKGPLVISNDDILVDLGFGVAESIDENRISLDEFQKNKIKGLLLEIQGVLNSENSGGFCDKAKTSQKVYSWAKKRFFHVFSQKLTDFILTKTKCSLYAHEFISSYTWAKRRWKHAYSYDFAVMIANEENPEIFKCFSENYIWAKKKWSDGRSYNHAVEICITK